MAKYKRCKNCGSYFLQYEERIVPAEYSLLDSLGRALLLLIPVIGWFAILSRKNFTKEITATCKECGYRKDITKRTSFLAKMLLFVLILYIVVLVLVAVGWYVFEVR